MELAKKLLDAKPDDPDLPSFENLSQVVNGISYYFVSPKLQSDFNPMCGMKDVWKCSFQAVEAPEPSEN